MNNGGSNKDRTKGKKNVPYLAASAKLCFSSTSSSSGGLSVLTQDH